MRELRKKLHSQSGASILLALLFLLACMMVGGSVLAAAVSNAGKLRSNYEEQQRYLALSSALRLVAGELEQAHYYGWYTVNEWTETVTIMNPDGSVTTDTTPYYNIQQAMGAFDCGPLSELNGEGKTPVDSGGVPLDQEVLTFRKELDGLFAKEFTGTGYETKVATASLPTNPPGAPDEDKTTRELTLTVRGAEELGKKFGTAKVTVDMSQGRRLHLRAWLDDEPAYVMEAELAAAGNMPAIKYPADKEPKIAPGVNSNGDLVSRTEKTEAVTWKLDWISREVKEEKKGAGG